MGAAQPLCLSSPWRKLPCKVRMSFLQTAHPMDLSSSLLSCCAQLRGEVHVQGWRKLRKSLWNLLDGHLVYYWLDDHALSGDQ